MQDVLIIGQIVVSAALILAILVQSKGTGFGRAWSSRPKSFTLVGLERLVFRATFVLAATLVVISILQLVI